MSVEIVTSESIQTSYLIKGFNILSILNRVK